MPLAAGFSSTNSRNICDLLHGHLDGTDRLRIARFLDVVRLQPREVHIKMQPAILTRTEVSLGRYLHVCRSTVTCETVLHTFSALESQADPL
jgi:hypothetical protein